MSASSHPTSRHFILRLILVLLGVIVGLSFIPWGHRPSPAQWALAYIRGEGKPHFPVTGTPASRIHDMYDRNPGLRIEWEEVSPDENGFLLLRDFVKSEAATRMLLPEHLAEMLADDRKWGQLAVKDHLDTHQEVLKELRRIALLPDRSSQGRSPKESIKLQTYKSVSDVLLLSFLDHLRAKRMTEALADFTALYGFAAHMDGHELVNFEDKAAAIQVRLSPHDALCKMLKNAKDDIDWSPWIRVIQNVPSHGVQMEAVWRGEAWSQIQLCPAWNAIRQKNNPIWDFEAFEDAFARRVLISAKAYADASKPSDLKRLRKLKDEFPAQETRLSEPAREMLQKMQMNTKGLEQLMIRSEARVLLTLMALQLLQSENEEGPIAAADDMRLGSFALDPSTGEPFVFDPAKRQISAAEGSTLAAEKPVQLPTW